MNFVILSTPLYKLQQCDSAIFDIFKFDFESLEGIDISSIKTKVSDQIRFGLLSLLELLQSNCHDDCNKKSRYHDQQQCDNRLQVSMNFVLENKEYDHSIKGGYTKFNQSCCVDRACSQSSSEHERLFENCKNPTINPLDDIMNEVIGQKDDDDSNYQTNIVEFNDDYDDIDVESTRRSTPFAEYQNFDILAQLSEEESTKSFESMNSSQSNRGTQNVSDEEKEALFQLIHSIQSLHHSMMVYHKQLKIDNVSSIKTFESLFGLQPPRYLGDDLNHYADAGNDSVGSTTIECQKKRDRDSDTKPDVSLRRRKKNFQVPPTLTPMRPSRYSPSPQLCLSRNVSKTKVNHDVGSRSPTFQSSNNKQHLFVTPNNPLKRKSQCVSSEAPTIVVRLSSCLGSNSPLHSSVTPQNS